MEREIGRERERGREREKEFRPARLLLRFRPRAGLSESGLRGYNSFDRTSFLWAVLKKQ